MYVLIELQGRSRKKWFEHEEKCKGTKMNFVQTKDASYPVIFSDSPMLVHKVLSVAPLCYVLLVCMILFILIYNTKYLRTYNSCTYLVKLEYRYELCERNKRKEFKNILGGEPNF